MFNFLGRLAAGHPRIICAAWLIAGAALTLLAPRWEHTAHDDRSNGPLTVRGGFAMVVKVH